MADSSAFKQRVSRSPLGKRMMQSNGFDASIAHRFRRTLNLIVGSGFKAAPGPMTLTLLFTVVGACSSIAYPIGFKVLVDGIVDRRYSGLIPGIIVIAVSYSVTWAMGILVAVESVSLADRVGFYLSCRIAELVAAPQGIDHFERPEYLLELDLVHANRRLLAGGPRQTFALLQVFLRWAGILLVLALIEPWLVGLILFAIPIVWAARSGTVRQQRSDEISVEDVRLTNVLFAITVSATSAKEIRTFGLAEDLMSRHDQAAKSVIMSTEAVALRSSLVGLLAWLSYGVGFALALAIVTKMARDGRASPGDLLLSVTLIRQAQQQVTRISEVLGQLLVIIRTTHRFFQLEDYVDQGRKGVSDQAVPMRMSNGIRFDHVSFSYPGSATPVLEDINLFIPARSTIALVGENGAGKSSLVKLLTGMYSPTGGVITVDGIDLASFSMHEWRQRISASFQDSFPFELVARETVGVGDMDRVADDAAVMVALNRAGAPDLVQELPEGLDTRLGRSFPDGRELSGGQWQKIALGRAMMRDEPMVLVLDEPTAGLDAAAEYLLFNRYAEAAQRSADATGAITVLVSHRFSTVKMAQLIVVMSQGRVEEVGSHQELMRTGGTYSELFGMQARIHE
jgi:ATP-binding cassette, subfamily B, bacterial